MSDGTLDDETSAVYESGASVYEANRDDRFADLARSMVAAAGDGPVLDLGCGTGHYLEHLGARAVGIDAVTAMLDAARRRGRPLVRADFGRIPLRPGIGAAAWARNSYVHVPHDALPLALADLHRSLADGAPIAASFLSGPDDRVVADDDLPGRNFWRWSDERLRDVFTGAGFDDVRLDGDRPRFVHARRARSLPDTVGAGMRLLVCGLNPSLHAADAGVGFVSPSNRFWPAAIEAGIVTRDRDPWHALRSHGVGMTDLVKRATTRADELTTAEYRAGLERIERLCEVLAPAVVCFVGLSGWRAAVDRSAQAGPQRRRLGPSEVYLMPSTSGLNAHARREDLVGHLRAAARATSS